MQCVGAPLPRGSDGPVITVTGTAPATPGTDCLSGGITNSAQVTGNEADPILTNNTDATTACPAGSPKPAFTVAKTANVQAPNFAAPGSTVTYTVTVTNTGGVDYTAANPAAFTNILDDATLDPASLTGGAQISGNAVTWSGALPARTSTTVTYQVTVNNPDLGDHLLRNAVVPSGTGTCASATACEVTTPVPDFTATKTAAPATTTPGGKVTYTITVTNTGTVNFGGTTALLAPAAQVSDSLLSSGPRPRFSHGDALFASAATATKRSTEN